MHQKNWSCSEKMVVRLYAETFLVRETVVLKDPSMHFRDQLHCRLLLQDACI
jgi:hypothetical protein